MKFEGSVRERLSANAFAWMTVSCVLFSFMNLLARVASEHVPWTMVAASRAGTGALVAFLVAHARRVPPRVFATRLMWGRSISGTIALACTFYALSVKTLPLGDACTLFSMSPIFLALFAPVVLGERTGKIVWVALPLSTLGVMLIVKPSFLFPTAHGSFSLAGLPSMIALVAALFSSFSMMLLRRMSGSESPESVAFHFGCLAFVVLSIASIHHMQMPSPSDVLRLIGAGLCGGFAQLAMTRAYALEQAARIGAFSNLIIVITTALGAFVLREIPEPLRILGMGLVVTTSVMISIRAMQRQHIDDPAVADQER